MNTVAQTNPVAERFISELIQKGVPYDVRVAGTELTIRNHKVYPPGTLTEMFVEYLFSNNILKDKTIADVGAGCFALGIISAKNGAKMVVGTDINPDAIDCARENLESNNILGGTHLLIGDGLSPLFPTYEGKIDVLLSGAPWDTISSSEYNEIPDEKKAISRAFYDVDDRLILDILHNGKLLLSPQGKTFITSSMRTINRIEKLCSANHISVTIVKEDDLHHDGNVHYVLELKRSEGGTEPRI